MTRCAGRYGHEHDDRQGREQESRERPGRPRLVHEVDAHVDEHEQRKGQECELAARDDPGRFDRRIPREAGETRCATATLCTGVRSPGCSPVKRGEPCCHIQWRVRNHTSGSGARPEMRPAGKTRASARSRLGVRTTSRPPATGPTRRGKRLGLTTMASPASSPAHACIRARVLSASARLHVQYAADSVSLMGTVACASSTGLNATSKAATRPVDSVNHALPSAYVPMTSASAARGDTRYMAQSPRTARRRAMCSDVPGGYNASAVGAPSAA